MMAKVQKEDIGKTGDKVNGADVFRKWHGKRTPGNGHGYKVWKKS